MSSQNYPSFIDFEASGLATGTYPIEVAWSLPDGTVREYLIRPEPSWTYWETRAEEVHGINRGQLLIDGVSAANIGVALCRDLVGQDVYADGGYYDAQWLRQLLAAGGCQEQPFRLYDCTPDLFFPDMPFQTRCDIQEAAWEIAGKRHRAGNDVRWLIACLRLAREGGYRTDVPNSVSHAKI